MVIAKRMTQARPSPNITQVRRELLLGAFFQDAPEVVDAGMGQRLRTESTVVCDLFEYPDINLGNSPLHIPFRKP